MKNAIRVVEGAGILTLLIIIGVVWVLPHLHDFEMWANPVKSDWTVTWSKLEGRELTISGTMVKHRNCQYIPGPRARDSEGHNYFI